MISDPRRRVAARAAMKGFFNGGAWREGYESASRGTAHGQNPYDWAVNEQEGLARRHGLAARSWWNTGWRVREAARGDTTACWLHKAFNLFNREELERFIPHFLKRVTAEQQLHFFAEYLWEFIPLLIIPTAEQIHARIWRDCWVKFGQRYPENRHPEFRAALEAIDRAVRYRSSYDPELISAFSRDSRIRLEQLFDP